jgi:zinc protease
LNPTNDPLVSFRILFNVGAANDPQGKQGLAALTASMISEAGSRSMKYEEIVQAMYPLATSFGSQVDKEMTVFSGTTHIDNLEKYYGIVSGMLLDPGFREEDFTRVKDDTINYVKVSLRGNNEEELGKEALYLDIYKGHPYGHLNSGTLAALGKMTLDDVKSFYEENYTRANLVLGMAGGYSDAFKKRVEADFGKLPEGKAAKVALSKPKPFKGRHLTIIQKETRACAISFGFPIDVVRSDKDWIALDLVRSWLGQHRNSSAHLFKRIREVRGMNYGNYAYTEYFPRGMFQFIPDTNLVRRQQIFQIWIRPVEPQNAHFALRIGMYELGQLVKNGLTQEQFEETRKFLRKNAALVVQTLSQRLGHDLDGTAYGYDDYVGYVREGLERLTLDDVNAAIKKHLTADNVRIVMIHKEAEELREAILAEKPSSIKYGSPKPREILDEDKIIEKFPLEIAAANARIVPVEEVFAR